jgi:hypothetical protein
MVFSFRIRSYSCVTFVKCLLDVIYVIIVTTISDEDDTRLYFWTE